MSPILIVIKGSKLAKAIKTLQEHPNLAIQIGERGRKLVEHIKVKAPD